MRKPLVLFFLVTIGVLLGVVYFFTRPEPPLETKFVQPETPLGSGSFKGQGGEETPLGLESFEGQAADIKQPGEYHLLKAPRQVYQTFNNCGPATLSMVLSWYGADVSQKELGDQMRPIQNPQGDNDDKTIFPDEFVEWAEKYGLSAVYRVNGSLDLLKLFVVNDIPVVTKTWLRPNEDIGHFRFVRGFDEGRGVIIQDDSYHGSNKKISYYDFLSMWQPFNYGYIVVYPKEREDIVFSIIGKEFDESVAFGNALVRAQKESELDAENIYPVFNQSTSSYHIGNFEASVEAFERVEVRLPRRMLWYQIEPILAYQKLGRFNRVFEITDKLLDGGNRAFSEVYLMRGEIYLAQGDKAKAREQFELALKYKPGYEEAQNALEGIQNM